MQNSFESIDKFIVPGCDMLVLVEVTEESLNAATRLVSMPIDFSRSIFIPAWQVDNIGSIGLNDCDQSVNVVVFFGSETTGGYRLDRINEQFF